jgi:hypothetical protein
MGKKSKRELDLGQSGVVIYDPLSFFWWSVEAEFMHLVLRRKQRFTISTVVFLRLWLRKDHEEA